MKQENDIPYLKHVYEMGLCGCVVVGGLFFMPNGPNQVSTPMLHPKAIVLRSCSSCFRPYSFFNKTPTSQMKSYLLDVLKLIFIFAISTQAAYVSLKSYIIFHIHHDSLHKRDDVFHERGSHSYKSFIHNPSMNNITFCDIGCTNLCAIQFNIIKLQDKY